MEQSSVSTSENTYISVLPEVVQNKIAAGEVVERPASVVKELAENALDAGAKRVVIELDDGGHRLIRVTDDGCGMGETDLALCLERHATSKIKDVDDIFAITSMGFRGEALPSIGSVSRLTIRTALQDADSGHEVVVEGGKKIRFGPCPPRDGTVVEVRDLFYNTPARLKFMKSPGAEVAAINETVTRLALAWPRVAFRVINSGKTSLDLPVHGNAAERVGCLFGRDLASSLQAVHYDGHEGLVIEGFVARPPESRSNSRTIYTFLNRRWIRHPGLVRVIRDAYGGALPPRRYPFAVLYLTVDPSRVDVNVHPTKEEVRFENDRLVVGSTRRAVSEALCAPSVDSGGVNEPPQKSPQESTASRQHSEFKSEQSTPVKSAAESAPEYAADHSGRTSAQRSMQNDTSAPVATCPDSPSASPQRENEPSNDIPSQRELPLKGISKHRVLAQAGGKYLIVESPDGIKLVDQHALHERWNYEKLRDRTRLVTSQKLIVPVVVELSPHEAALFDEALPVLREAGFDVEPFGVAALSVSAAPDLVRLNSIERVIRDVFAEVSEGQGGRTLEGIRDTMLKSLACRSAVLFGTQLPHAALIALMDKYYEAKQPLTCPHGRPTTVTITWSELERRFGRA